MSGTTAQRAAGSAVADRRLRVALTLIVSCEFMLQLDTTIINVALPTIRHELGFSLTGLSWITNAFLLTFGGLLLLGGRLGDLRGHRRVFLFGTALFTASSLVGGLATNDLTLVLTRAGQGVGAAFAAPTGIALLATNFRDEARRNRAFAVYSTVSGSGLALGLVLGGVLTSALSWRWVLFINVPFGLAVILLTPKFISESETGTGRFDLAGAFASTASMTALVYALIRVSEQGWGDPTALVAFAIGLALFAALITIESRVAHPVLPLGLFRGGRSAAYASLLLVAATLTSMWFFLTQFLQEALGMGPLTTGLAFLPMAATVFAGSQVVPRLLTRVSPKPVAIAGTTAAVIATSWLGTLSESSGYAGSVLGPLLLLGVGAGLSMVSLNLIVMSATPAEETGAASGVLQSMLTVGGSLGLAILVTVAGAANRSAEPGTDPLVAGVSGAFAGAAVFAGIALLITVFALRTPSRPGAVRTDRDEAV
ncbi:drug resistance transporter, EmrB/QacA subfamily [Streptoalloteichus tenebrarius]|uniref:Drug resistance transporter, EmrB/QacA subfamily n=1 Tax=Streptoalloteichus tenebrarius (strain ATCC 17920 / DSM 40477 / JCM 4838 / CBS 697.72 / NBRC 16177 / NCIMB 11028 / NRRL B-12390 / A12253. 1 / ISP 5477) TaxID=1933 RepID=A0ABT1I077_STRSD|nr:MFS transporter [Streptoalloteichus tenebrarius]MCP2261150.1 drug resistance transporter, EmrB/QacA subfamily [Streptoalloteichus tenebrarius]BFF03938.1 MFS transporter [Streptoalloteichus tenebrarius]